MIYYRKRERERERVTMKFNRYQFEDQMSDIHRIAYRYFTGTQRREDLLILHEALEELTSAVNDEIGESQ